MTFNEGRTVSLYSCRKESVHRKFTGLIRGNVPGFCTQLNK